MTLSPNTALLPALLLASVALPVQAATAAAHAHHAHHAVAVSAANANAAASTTSSASDTNASATQAPVPRPEASARPRVSDAWIAEAPPGARHNAAYLELRNGARADTLLTVSTPVAEVVELHEMRMEQGVMRMRREDAVELAPGQQLRLAPGGRHLMLINMRRSLRVGEKVPLTLRFRDSGALTVQAEVKPLPVDDEPAHSHSH